jgi:hypothetical protein
VGLTVAPRGCIKASPLNLAEPTYKCWMRLRSFLMRANGPFPPVSLF